MNSLLYYIVEVYSLNESGENAITIVAINKRHNKKDFFNLLQGDSWFKGHTPQIADVIAVEYGVPKHIEVIL